MAALTTATSGFLVLTCSAVTTTHHRLQFLSLPKPNTTPFSPLTTLSLKLPYNPPKNPTFLCFSTPILTFPQNPLPQISNSTQTLAILLALSLSLTTKITQIITNFALKIKSFTLTPTPTPQELQTIQYLQNNVLCTMGPLFFAAVKDRASLHLNTPLTVVAAGMAKWLDIYSGVLLVRVLLSWFPNIPWDRQPLSAIRDLCDPYLNLFRNIIPPVFDTLDISPLFAFTVLGILASILNSAKGV